MNALFKLGNNTAQIVGPEARKDNYNWEIMSWIGQWLEHQDVKLEIRVQAPAQYCIFFFNSKTSQEEAFVWELNLQWLNQFPDTKHELVLRLYGIPITLLKRRGYKGIQSKLKKIKNSTINLLRKYFVTVV